MKRHDIRSLSHRLQEATVNEKCAPSFRRLNGAGPVSYRIGAFGVRSSKDFDRNSQFESQSR